MLSVITNLKVLGFVILAGLQVSLAVAGDWPEWRGPSRDGTSQEKGLPVKWARTGENLVWKQPYGGRSAPIIMGGRVFLFNSAGEGETMQERVMALDANTGKLLWEHRLNVYESDVPPRRIAWSSPAGDPATGNVYVFGACNELTALSSNGKVLWSRSLTEEFGAWTTHGGRTVSPIIEGDLVIVSTVTDGWGELAQRRHRYYAFNKMSGEAVWISTPGGRPFDTTYSTPITTAIDGMRIMIAGAGDGTVNALKVSTGEPVWTYAVSKRGVNPSVVLKGNTAIVSHQEENLDTSEMGLLAAVNAASKGTIGKEQIQWAIRNAQLGPASPVIDGDRIYHVDAGSNLFAFDINTGKEIWKQNLGTIQKASLVLADGKLFVGTENGKFFILKPGAASCQVLDEDELEPVDKVQTKTEAGDDLIASNEQIIASVGVARGRIYLVSTKAIYCIGKRSPAPAQPAAKAVAESAPANAAVAHVQIVPVDLVMRPGETAKFKARLFDDRGRFIREELNAAWSLEGLKGELRQQQLTAGEGIQAGKVKAAVGQVSGVAQVRVIPPVSIAEDLSAVAVGAAPAYWINTTGKYAVREMEGNRVLVKSPTPPIFKRTRSFLGPASGADYTVEADVRAAEKRRQMGDAGVVAQRYEMVLVGSGQRLELRSWQIEEKRTVKKPFAWKPDVWYRLKLRVENLPGGKVSVRGKAWPAADAEPGEWTLERVDPSGNRHGSAGIFADAPNEVFFDNLKVTKN
jgi:outer membrane protein assembly factor BamB